MPEPVDTPEEINAHKTHATGSQPETCDLCWMETPFTSQEIKEMQESGLEESGMIIKS